MPAIKTGHVYIIGAGPGDPGLVSARGVSLLARADVVVYDRVVERVLRWARPDAECIAAGAPAERETAQDAISMLLAEKAREGHIVARLKWGDAFVYDSGAKEALFLYDEGIPFEIVPGIPASIGSTAYAGIPVTYPGFGDALVLLRGSEDVDGPLPDIDWDGLASVESTIVCFAGARLVPVLLQTLLDHGYASDTPAALIYDGTLPTQQTVTGSIGLLCDRTTAEPGAHAALVVVGRVAGLRRHLRWFDERPLFGRRILITRSEEQGADLVEAIENLGAQAIQAPTYRVLAAEDPTAIDRAAASVQDYRWIVFETASAVSRFLGALARGPRDLRALGHVLLCAIGPSTSDRLVAAGLNPDVTMAEVGAERVSDAMAAKGPLTGQRVLLVRPEHVRRGVADDLERRGAIVTDLIAYRTAPAPSDSPAAQEIYRLLLEGRVDAVTFTSPTAVRRFAAMVGEEHVADLLGPTVVVAIGPVTAAAAMALGIGSPLVAEPYTVQGLVDTLVEHLRQTSGATKN